MVGQSYVESLPSCAVKRSIPYLDLDQSAAAFITYTAQQILPYRVVLLQEAPVLGAWGLGWEVWCDGQEITQFTYFQQAGGQPLSHPAIEITYGLERILMALQVRCSPDRNTRGWKILLIGGHHVTLQPLCCSECYVIMYVPMKA